MAEAKPKKQKKDLATKLFVAIDKMFDHGQNEIKMLKFPGVEFVEEKDIPYGEHERQKLDTYYVAREDGSKYPTMLLIHGGGFVAGDKYHRRGLARWVADKGFFVVAINYALAPQDKFPTSLTHMVAALNWIGENAEKYNLDLDNLCVSGDSAGGYHAAMLACIATHPELQERLGVHTDLKFRTAWIDCGIYDVEAALSNKLPFNLTDQILHDFTSVHIEGLAEYENRDILAPFAFVDETFPISFITYAEKDFFCKGQGQKLVQRLEECGVYVESHHSTKLIDNHCYPLNWNKGAAIENVKLSEIFLRKVASKEI